jgi:fluoride exporter
VNAVLLVAAGGALGSVTRHGLNLYAGRVLGNAFPWGILLVNVGGCFAMGLVAAGLLRAPLPDALRLFLATGFLGGFTTFSAFALDTMKLVQGGQVGLATVYVLASVVISLIAVFAGFWLMRATLA